MVADGLGGGPAGHVAAAIAISSIHSALSKLPTIDSDLTNKAFRTAQIAISDAVKRDPNLSRMGTTLVLAFIERTGLAHFGHVGDSRAYRIPKECEIELWTIDQNAAGMQAYVTIGMPPLPLKGMELLKYENELKSLGGANTLNSALGTTSLDPTHQECQLVAGDWLLICSDGLTNALRKNGINLGEYITNLRKQGIGLEEAARRIADLATPIAEDNATFVLVEHKGIN